MSKVYAFRVRKNFWQVIFIYIYIHIYIILKILSKNLKMKKMCIMQNIYLCRKKEFNSPFLAYRKFWETAWWRFKETCVRFFVTKYLLSFFFTLPRIKNLLGLKKKFLEKKIKSHPVCLFCHHFIYIKRKKIKRNKFFQFLSRVQITLV